MLVKTLLTYGIKTATGIYFALTVMGIGLFTLLLDAKQLNNNGKKKDAKIAKVIGISYILIGPILYLIGKII